MKRIGAGGNVGLLGFDSSIFLKEIHLALMAGHCD